LKQANTYLSACGAAIIRNTHTITITSSNVVVSIPNNEWPAGGIVTIRIESGTVSSISVETSGGTSIVATARTNNLNANYSNYYTFEMPDDDVIVTIS
jgi:hypothetical protein